MILAIPFHPSLLDYSVFASHLRKRGSNPGHTLAVIASREHEEEAFKFGNDMASLFHRQFLSITPEANLTPVAASNRMFKAAVEFHRKYAPDRQEIADPAMLYHDPTWRPTKNRWLDELQSDYYLKGAPTVFGHFPKLKADPPDPTPIGPVVLAKDFCRKTKLLDFLPHDQHWRGYLAWEMVKLGLDSDAFGVNDPAYIRYSYTPKK